MLNAFRERGWRVAKQLRRTLRPDRGDGLTVLVLGVQRSGTNMLLDLFEQSWQTEVLRDYDQRVYEDYLLRFPEQVGRIRARSGARALVLKVQHDTERARELMDRFEPARAIWNYRHFEESVRSILTIWPGTRNGLETLIADPSRTEWRGLGMTPATLAIVREHYQEGMNDASANALFWYYRNQLLFDQGLDGDPRMVVVRYEDLAREPARTLPRLSAFLGIEPTERMAGVIRPERAKRRPELELLPNVRRLCETMLARLEAVRMDIDGPPPAPQPTEARR